MKNILILIPIVTLLSCSKSKTTSPNSVSTAIINVPPAPGQKTSTIVMNITTGNNDSVEYVLALTTVSLVDRGMTTQGTQQTETLPAQTDSVRAQISWWQINRYNGDTVQVRIYDNNKLIFNRKAVNNTLGSYFNWK